MAGRTHRPDRCKNGVGCSLWKTCNTVRLDGRGKPKHPYVMFVGEAPGRLEDRDGLVFHPEAAAGSKMQVLVEEMNLSKDCYFTNAVRCRPPDNRNPRASELRVCNRYLVEEIKKVKPKHIVALGQFAIRALTGEERVAVSHKRGIRSWEYMGIPVIATYHPAAALRTEALWDKIAEDLNRLVSREYVRPQKLKWEVVRKVTPRLIYSSMAFDLETSQISPWKSGGRILCVSWSGKDNVARVSKDTKSFFASCATRCPKLVGHNVKFDLAWARMAHSYSHAGPVDDTMVLAHLTDENRPSKGLKYLASHYTGYGDYGAGVMAYRNRGQMEKLDEKALFEYCAYDSAATWLIYQYLAKELEDQGLELLYRAQMRVLMTLLGMEQRGFQASLERAKVMEVEMGAKVDRMARSIIRRMGLDVNLDSTKQLAKALFEDLGYKPHTLTKGRQPSVGEGALELLYDQVPAGLSRQRSVNLINDILERRKLKMVVSTYLISLPDNVDSQERIHATYNLTGTPTGRLSCSDPNLQNIPREEKSPVKQIFVAPKGRVLVVADYSQIELRIVAWKTRDETMLRLFEEGLDLHAETARSILGHEPTSEERSHAKTVNFGVLYGMGVYALARQTGKSIAWAKRYLKDWNLTYPAVPNWKNEIKRELQERGYVTNAFGRRRRLPVHVAGGPKEYERMLRQACNHPIQGTPGELCLFAMVLVEEVLSRKLESAWIVGEVHDNLIVECRWGDRKRVANIMRKVMTDANAVVAEFGFNDIDFDVPTPVEVKAGRCWAEMEEI